MLTWLAPAVLWMNLSAGASPAHTDEALIYDANDNVLTRTLPGRTSTYGYNPLDRLSSDASPAKIQASLNLDASSRLDSDIRRSGIEPLQYGSFGQRGKRRSNSSISFQSSRSVSYSGWGVRALFATMDTAACTAPNQVALRNALTVGVGHF